MNPRTAGVVLLSRVTYGAARAPLCKPRGADARSALCLALGVPPDRIDSLGYDVTPATEEAPGE